jgi:acetylornithine deacetylase
VTAAGAVAARIERDRESVVELLRELVRIPSVNPAFEIGDGLNREADVQRVVAEHLRAAGLQTETYEVVPGRPNVLAHAPGGDERSLILNGHVDVVPVGEAGAWSVDPFGGEIRDGRLYGRGSYDMKCGIAAMVAAAKALHGCGVELAGRLELHSVVDEEAGGSGSIDLVRRGRTASALVCTEATDGAIVVVEGGLEWVRVTIRGRTGHAGSRYAEVYPQPEGDDRESASVNAAELAARLILAVGELERDWGRRKPPHRLLPPGINTISPGVVRAGAGLGENGLPAIMDNPAMTPDAAVVDFDLKFLPAERSEDVRREFEDFVARWAAQDSWLREHPPSVRWELGGLFFAPFDTAPGHPIVTALGGAVGGNAPLRGFTGVCDAAHYAGAGVVPVVHGPTGGGAHAPDEWVDVESVVAAAKAYAAAAIAYCGTR